MKVYYKDKNGNDNCLDFEDVHGDPKSLGRIKQNMAQFLSTHETSHPYLGHGYTAVIVDDRRLDVEPCGLSLNTMIQFLSKNFGFDAESEDLGVIGNGGNVVVIQE